MTMHGHEHVHNVVSYYRISNQANNVSVRKWKLKEKTQQMAKIVQFCFVFHSADSKYFAR